MSKRFSRAVTLLFSDMESVASMGLQAVSLLLPLVLFRQVWTSAGADTLILFEALVALHAFLTICVEWGTKFLVAAELRPEGNLRSFCWHVFRFRLRNWLVCVAFLAMAAIIDSTNVQLYVLAALASLTSVIGVEFAFLHWGEMHRYQAILLLRPTVPILFLLFGQDALVGFVVGAALVALFQLWILVRRTSGRSWLDPESVKLRRKYGPVALNEIATAVFAQLDAYWVGQLLPAGESVVYLTIRKLVRAGLSILTYAYRVLYQRLIQGTGSRPAIAWIALYSVGGLIGFIIGWRNVVEGILGIPVSPDDPWVPVVVLFGSLFIVGLVKGLVVNVLLLRNQMFRLYLTVTVVSLSATVIAAMWVTNWTAPWASAARVAPDVLFLIIIGVIWRSGLSPVAEQVSENGMATDHL